MPSQGVGQLFRQQGSCSVIGPGERTEEKHDVIWPRPGRRLEKTGLMLSMAGVTGVRLPAAPLELGSGLTTRGS